MNWRGLTVIAFAAIVAGGWACSSRMGTEEERDLVQRVQALERSTGAVKDSLVRWYGKPPADYEATYDNWMDWARKISSVVCLLEDSVQVHGIYNLNPALATELCPDTGNGDPHEPPPPPPDLEG